MLSIPPLVTRFVLLPAALLAVIALLPPLFYDTSVAGVTTPSASSQVQNYHASFTHRLAVPPSLYHAYFDTDPRFSSSGSKKRLRLCDSSSPHYYPTDKVSIHLCPKGHVLYGGLVLTSERRILHLGQEQQGESLALTASEERTARQWWLPKASLLHKRVAAISTSCCCNYEEWLLSVLPRIEALKGSNIPFDLLYLPPITKAYQKETLAILGISSDQILEASSKSHYACDQILVPTLIASSGAGRCRPKASQASQKPSQKAPPEAPPSTQEHPNPSIAPPAPPAPSKPTQTAAQKSTQRISLCGLDPNPYTLSASKVAFLRETYKAKPNKNPIPKKLFICSKKEQELALVNEESLTEKLLEIGYVKIYEEDLSFQEQVRLFSKAQEIISLRRPFLANLVFCDPSVQVMELVPHEDQGKDHCDIAAYLGIEYKTVYCEEAQSPRTIWIPSTSHGAPRQLVAPVEDIMSVLHFL